MRGSGGREGEEEGETNSTNLECCYDYLYDIYYLMLIIMIYQTAEDGDHLASISIVCVSRH